MVENVKKNPEGILTLSLFVYTALPPAVKHM